MVNPHDVTGLAEAIKKALTMPDAERTQRMRAMQERLRRHDVHHWASSFPRALHRVGKVEVTLLEDEARRKLVASFQRASSRVLFLDYNGSLVPLASNPQEAKPDRALKGLLKGLATLPGVEVVVVSGRPRDTLDAWLGTLPVSLVAEHGGWMRERGQPWRSWSMNVDPGWKTRIYPILEEFYERLPGSFVEEKTFALAWHYRRPTHKWRRPWPGS